MKNASNIGASNIKAVGVFVVDGSAAPLVMAFTVTY
jgi:hypothetical protein